MKCPKCGNIYGFWCLGDVECKIGSTTDDILEVNTHPFINYESDFTCSKCNYEGDYSEFIGSVDKE